MPSQNQPIHTHHLNSTPTPPSTSTTNPLALALQKLKPHLPTSLPLYRRLQFGRFFAATTLLTNLDHSATPSSEANGTNADDAGNTAEEEKSPWLIAFLDRSCRPETEAWLFGSWESSPHPPSPEQQAKIDELLTSLVQTMKIMPLPKSIHHDPSTDESTAADKNNDRDNAGFSRNDYAGHANDANVMLWGAVHERTVTMLDRLGFVTKRFKTGMVANRTFVFDVDSLARYDQRPLPEGLEWGELGRKDFALVRSRTQIPRQDRTLAVLPNVGVFSTSTGEALAWAFVGLDASLTTLHVEKGYRGKGLAKAVTTKLFLEKMDGFWEEGLRRLAHGYVIDGNKESEGMCRSLGGRSEWMCYWVRVDLGLVS